MKQKLAVVLCILFVFYSGSIPVFAAEQQDAEESLQTGAEETAAEQVDAVGALAPRTEKVEEQTAAGIQDKLDINEDGRYQLTVKLPAGTYPLNKTLYVHPNTTIIAEPGAILIKQRNYGAMLEAKLTDDDGGYDGNHDITIQGGTWDSTPCMKNGGTESFRFIHCNNITIKNVKLCNVPAGSHLIVLAGVKNASIANCEFSGYGTDPVKGYLSAKVPKEAIQLDVVRKEVVPTGQAEEIKNWDDLPCDTVTVTDCKFHEFSRGIGSHTAVAGMLHNRVTIERNTFLNMSDSAIRLYNYKNSVVRNNYISNAAEGILIYTYIGEAAENVYFQPNSGKIAALPANYNITVSDNIIDNISDENKTWGDGIRVIGGLSRKLQGVTIKYNRISKTSRYGIFTSAAPNLTITYNKIELTKKDGILLNDDCSSSVVTGNAISRGEEDGISAYHSDRVTITGNTIASVKENGIYLLDSDYCMIGNSRTECNTILSPGKNGISVSRLGSSGTGCNSTDIRYNQISKPGKNGIFVCKSVNTKIRENTVKETNGNGIFVSIESRYTDILNNNVYQSAENGISLTSLSQYSKIQGNTVKEYGTANRAGAKSGIIVYKSGGNSRTNTVVLKNRITGTGKKSGRNAIHISVSPNVTVSGNTIEKADGSGIYLYQSSNSTIGKTKKDTNTVKNPKEYGIYITSDSKEVKAQYNKISGAGTAGVGVYDAKNSTVKGNVISSEKDGISVNTNSSFSKITGNTINSAGRNGITLSGGSRRSTVSDNTIKKYSVKKISGSGIYISKSGGTGKKTNTVISGNNITGTGKSKKKTAVKVADSAYTTLKKNTIKNAAGSGIGIYRSKKNTVENNKITAPRKNGIYISSGSGTAKVKGNTVTKAGDVSILLYNAPSSQVVSNKVTGSVKYIGIWARASHKTTIKNNTIKGTKKTKAVSVRGSRRCKVSKNKITAYKAPKKKKTSKNKTPKKKVSSKSKTSKSKTKK